MWYTLFPATSKTRIARVARVQQGNIKQIKNVHRIYCSDSQEWTSYTATAGKITNLAVCLAGTPEMVLEPP